jgi:hypothetical protein
MAALRIRNFAVRCHEDRDLNSEFPELDGLSAVGHAYAHLHRATSAIQ